MEVLKTIGNYTAVRFNYRRVSASIVIGMMALLVHLMFLAHPQQALDLTGSFFMDTLLAQFMHLSWAHLALNLAGLAVVAWGFEAQASGWMDLWSWIAALLGVAAYVSWCEPLVWYCGLSGALHAVFTAKLTLAWREAGASTLTRRAALPLIALTLGLIAKLMLEAHTGPSHDALAGGRVAIEAHRGGALIGLVCGLIAVAWTLRPSLRA